MPRLRLQRLWKFQQRVCRHNSWIRHCAPRTQLPKQEQLLRLQGEKQQGLPPLPWEPEPQERRRVARQATPQLPRR